MLNQIVNMMMLATTLFTAPTAPADLHVPRPRTSADADLAQKLASLASSVEFDVERNGTLRACAQEDPLCCWWGPTEYWCEADLASPPEDGPAGIECEALPDGGWACTLEDGAQSTEAEAVVDGLDLADPDADPQTAQCGSMGSGGHCVWGCNGIGGGPSVGCLCKNTWYGHSCGCWTGDFKGAGNYEHEFWGFGSVCS